MRWITFAALVVLGAATCVGAPSNSHAARRKAPRRSSTGVSILVPSGWRFRPYAEPADETNPKIPFAMGTWKFADGAIDRGPIPRGQVLIDIEESAPPYAPGFPRPTNREFPLKPTRFVLPAKPNTILPFAPGKSSCYLISFRAAGRFFGARVSVARPLSSRWRRTVENILSSLRVKPRPPR